MKTKSFLVMALMVLTGYGSAGAFGLPGLTKGGSAPAGDPDAFLAKAQVSEKLVNSSADSLFKLVASKEEQAKVEALQKKLAETTDAKEKNAVVQQIRESEAAVISKAAANKGLEEEARKWDEQKKKLATASLFNLALGAKQAADLVPQGQNLAKSLQSNPLLIAKAGALLDAVKALSGIGTGTTKVLTTLPSVFTSAKIDVKLPTSSADKPQEVAL
jgi:hypothetical protein